MPKTSTSPQFLLCVKNDGYPVALEVRKVYQAVPDRAAAARGFVRVIDESGEDYLYPEDFFVAVTLPQAVAKELAAARVGGTA